MYSNYIKSGHIMLGTETKMQKSWGTHIFIYVELIVLDQEINQKN